MDPVIAITSPGAMGAAIGGRLSSQGVKVLSSFSARSAASQARAAANRLIEASDDQLVSADFLLSIVPPKEAVAVAERLAPALARAERKAVYVDCNAVSPATAARIHAVITPTGAKCVDGGIVGGPPREDYTPRLYVSGAHAKDVLVLNRFGMDVRLVEGGIGAASALKLSYAGINKGTIALGAAMILAARRAGVEEELMQELSESQRALLALFARGIPDMFAKAERWAPEMREIADYVERGIEADIYDALADFYEHLATDLKGSRTEVAALEDFFRHRKSAE